ncbi:hypothetical protein BEL04_03825 [Mucilaginibacter sp. PPCGB 2223]|uniref:hypothetical protein n=1 Tax=Mucilaginibacter sp. PPCGB 2223 TaxID=1886027 RepID=UPI0008248909|nr:hypothetical protein [Mucilaginibacter sp. PPCGB 2223]OCX53439.1 hypothetical protein BEL04_03825 [Mucilaginibacter sp. PPCGB 2223]
MKRFVFDGFLITSDLNPRSPATIRVKLYYLDVLIAEGLLNKATRTMPFSLSGGDDIIASGELGVDMQPHEITVWGNIYIGPEHFDGIIAQYPLPK